MLPPDLGGMGGAQPLAITMNEGVALMPKWKNGASKNALKQNICDMLIEDIDEAIDRALEAKRKSKRIIHRRGMQCRASAGKTD